MGEAVSAEDIGAVIGHDKETVSKIAHQLMDEYKDAGRGMQIIELNGSFQMCTSHDMYDYVIRLTHQPKKHQLTDVMLETLAIVAYKQPVTKSEIERIRGVSCSHAINKLLEYGLITEAGRLNAPGRPILFATTEEFLRTFGVQSVEHLPSISPEQLDSFKTEAEEEVQMTLDI
jgi:segregation and condensation protein B